ncbi:MAG: 2-iminoacetate synthase ThiH [Candidatus Methanoplasma sp.]|jgi:2-iminoacetate synthase|nr:2-iminoacetate synthase ThiH [Candidatus Methanoplasma sp.]
MRAWTDAEDYAEGMERIGSRVMDSVMDAREGYDPSAFSERDAAAALASERLSPDGFAALLSPAAAPLLEEMAARARRETLAHFGNSVSLFTPIYVSNRCDGGCVYCGFRSGNGVGRAALSPAEAEAEMRIIASTGLAEALILTGESRTGSGVGYIGECVAAAARLFKSVGVEVYPMNSAEYASLRARGADYVTVFQETYDPERYAEVHLSGQKRVFSYRFDAQERALMGGMRGVAFGALMGLGDLRRDAFACGMHARAIQRKYPSAEISLSVPRLRPVAGSEAYGERVSERELLQTALAYRIFLPYAGITLSTRESARFRDGAAGLFATRMSAGVSVGVGERSSDSPGGGQFDIADGRSVEEIRRALEERGLQPVFSDYVRT